MSDVTFTERQQYWLDHVRAAATFDGNLAEYACSAGLKREPDAAQRHSPWVPW